MFSPFLLSFYLSLQSRGQAHLHSGWVLPLQLVLSINSQTHPGMTMKINHHRWSPVTYQPPTVKLSHCQHPSSIFFLIFCSIKIYPLVIGLLCCHSFQKESLSKTQCYIVPTLRFYSLLYPSTAMPSASFCCWLLLLPGFLFVCVCVCVRAETDPTR